MSGEMNILIAAVGGQGGLLASRIIAQAAMSEKLGVIVGETLGMAQRGGSVVSQVRIGKDPLSPVIPRGRGDIVLGLEPIETLRVAIQYASKRSLVIMNTQEVLPIDVRLKTAEYPEIERVVERLQAIAARVMILNATELAQKAGNLLTMNVVMVGALAAACRDILPLDAVRTALEACVGEKHMKENLLALELGYDQGP